MKIDIIAGARPNFMKIAPIIHEINLLPKIDNVSFRLIHTGQHFDKNMSHTFLEQLDIPEPHFNLGAGGGTQAEQTAAIMTGYEKVLMEEKPDLCLVVGDVTSTMACAITAQKMGVKVGHIEAGIRSGDWTMPEEINRIVTDSICNYYFTTTEQASHNLTSNGVSPQNVFFVGNTMIDTLLKKKASFFPPSIWDEIGLKEKEFFVLTLHRPANVDESNKFKELLSEIVVNTNGVPIIFPVHPRTKKIIAESIGEDELASYTSLHFVEPLSYLEFNFLVANTKGVITDSGGITEETTVLGIPCVTLRDNTERPETITIGTNELIGTNPEAIKPALNKIFEGNWKKGGIPKYWDGKTSSRIVKSILDIMSDNV